MPSPRSRGGVATLRLVLGEDKQGPIVAGTIVVAAVALMALTVFTSDRLKTVGPLLAFGVLFAVLHQTILRWRSLLVMIVLVILFIPIRRYSLSSSLPIHLEPYRLIVFFAGAAWVTSLLIDPRVRFRRTPLDGPLLLFLFIALASDIVNRGRVNSVPGEVPKKLLFFLSYLIVFYFTVSVIRRYSDVESVTRVLVIGGTILGFLGLLERNTGYDVFNHLQSVFPFLHLDASQIPHLHRGGRLRVYASAQHPIALGAALAMLVPFGIYLTRRRGGRLWWIAVTLLTFGALSTGSRTSIIVFGAIGLVYLLGRPGKVLRLWPLLVPALLAIHLAVPGSLGTIRSSFFPKGGIIAQQTNASVGSGRLATLGPALHREFSPNPLLGEGFGTRVTVPDPPSVPTANGPILDDQWLGILIETGVAGALALLWVYLRFMRRLWPATKDEHSPRSWFLLAAVASAASFATSMFFYDAFSFIQVTFMLFIVLGLGVSAYLAPEPMRVAAPVPHKARQQLLPRLNDPQGQPT